MRAPGARIEPSARALFPAPAHAGAMEKTPDYVDGKTRDPRDVPDEKVFKSAAEAAKLRKGQDAGEDASGRGGE